MQNAIERVLHLPAGTGRELLPSLPNVLPPPLPNVAGRAFESRPMMRDNELKIVLQVDERHGMAREAAIANIESELGRVREAFFERGEGKPFADACAKLRTAKAEAAAAASDRDTLRSEWQKKITELDDMAGAEKIEGEIAKASIRAERLALREATLQKAADNLLPAVRAALAKRLDDEAKAIEAAGKTDAESDRHRITEAIELPFLSWSENTIRSLARAAMGRKLQLLAKVEVTEVAL